MRYHSGRRLRPIHGAICFCWLVGSSVCAEESIDLIRLDAQLDEEAVTTQDAEIVRISDDSGTRLRIETGQRARWPGVTLKAPDGHWDLSRRTYLAVDVSNVGGESVTVHCRVDNPGANGKDNCLTGSLALEPGHDGSIVVPIQARWPGAEKLEFIGMRGDPPVTSPLDPSNVIQLVIFVSQPRAEHEFEIASIRAGGEREPPRKVVTAEEFFPMIDPMGQYIHEDWPGKTHSVEELKEARKREAEKLAARPGPPDRNRFGGWSVGPQLEPTGFFRAEKLEGKWWLVDPEGRLFWSHGIDCVRSGNATPITDREHYFQDLPGPDSPFARFYGAGSWAPHGYYKDHSPYRTYDFSQANLLRKYGDDWPDAFVDVTHRRLKSWGFNTIANWSDRDIYLLRRTPYVATVHVGATRLEGSTGYWGKFYDVFDPEFRATLRRRLEGERERAAGDPRCIGFFVDNELSWGGELSLAVATLASPRDQAAKRAFVDDLRSKYATIEKLNDSWGSKHASWEALLESTEPPDESRAREDLAAFYTKTAETYFRTVREEVKRVAPRQLYLGCRFAWVNERAARAAAKYCDVVSYNRYAYSVASHRLPDGVDKPVIIGEFHFGALDRGLFHTGLRKARDQEHRAQLYADYVRGALSNPLIVGTHWFQYKDQATTGRGDGENYQIGFIDVCDRPYPEIVAAARDVGYRLYEIRRAAGD